MSNGQNNGQSGPSSRVATGLLLLGLTLGLSLVAAASVASRAFLQARSVDQALEVKGFAERHIESNLARWRGGITTRASSLDEAYAALARDRERLIALLDAAGVPVEERSLARDEFYIADEVFMVGTAAEVTPVREIDDRPVGAGIRGPVTKEVQDRYFAAVRGVNTPDPKWLDIV